ncbi:hypothetical protein C8R46DRAFT_1079023 [Mycena filopes]|nr:hypothetical protein C8R46DRAFT_1130624 [Mycena filopes]KAJ7175470.1 hypothetical protein C8R46DRAFT_1079023 [Mycena filopes]
MGPSDCLAGRTGPAARLQRPQYHPLQGLRQRRHPHHHHLRRTLQPQRGNGRRCERRPPVPLVRVGKLRVPLQVQRRALRVRLVQNGFPPLLRVPIRRQERLRHQPGLVGPPSPTLRAQPRPSPLPHERREQRTLVRRRPQPRRTWRTRWRTRRWPRRREQQRRQRRPKQRRLGAPLAERLRATHSPARRPHKYPMDSLHTHAPYILFMLLKDVRTPYPPTYTYLPPRYFPVVPAPLNEMCGT